MYNKEEKMVKVGYHHYIFKGCLYFMIGSVRESESNRFLTTDITSFLLYRKCEEQSHFHFGVEARVS